MNYGSCEICVRGAVPAARPDAMSDDRALKSWVSDRLHELLGFAEGNLASYVVGLGTSRREGPSPVAEETTITRSPPCVSHVRNLRPPSGPLPARTFPHAPSLRR